MDRTEEVKYGVAFSQLHSLAFADLNGDGIKDIVTGKRYWSHNTTGDLEPMGAAVLYAFLQKRETAGTTFTPVLIDSAAGSGCRLETVDLNGDGYPDVVVSSKKVHQCFFIRRSTQYANLKLPKSEEPKLRWQLRSIFCRQPPKADADSRF